MTAQPYSAENNPEFLHQSRMFSKTSNFATKPWKQIKSVLLTTREVRATSLEGYSSLFSLANKEFGILFLGLVEFWAFVSFFSPLTLLSLAYLDHDFTGSILSKPYSHRI